MPRIRTIKPEFWADEKMAAAPIIDRLVFLGLISLADDMGRVLDNLKVIDAWIFPRSEESAATSLARLTVAGRLRRGLTDVGQPVIEIVNWKRHQRINKPNFKACLPKISNGIRLDGSSPTPPRYVTDVSVTRPGTIPTTNDLRSTTNEPVVPLDILAVDAWAERRPGKSPTGPQKLNSLLSETLAKIQESNEETKAAQEKLLDARISSGMPT